MTAGESADAVEALVRAIEELRAERDEDRAVIDELQIALAGPIRRRPLAKVYPDWVSWVDEWLTVRVSRRPQRVRWCHRYAEHPEVADRLEALWHAWEAQWPEPEARLGWFRDGLDHQLGVITADDGPLRECSAHEGQHVVAVPLGQATSAASAESPLSPSAG